MTRWEYTPNIDFVPPLTFIANGPSGLTNESSPEFDFAATEAGATFKCSLNGTPFHACTSPTSYEALEDGPYTLRVRAGDHFGNQDQSPAERTFEVDSTSPETTIDSPTPTYTNHETPTAVEFSANEGE